MNLEEWIKLFPKDFLHRHSKSFPVRQLPGRSDRKHHELFGPAAGGDRHRRRFLQARHTSQGSLNFRGTHFDATKVHGVISASLSTPKPSWQRFDSIPVPAQNLA